jgi:hypothetical protein
MALTFERELKKYGIPLTERVDDFMGDFDLSTGQNLIDKIIKFANKYSVTPDDVSVGLSGRDDYAELTFSTDYKKTMGELQNELDVHKAKAIERQALEDEKDLRDFETLQKKLVKRGKIKI